FNLVAQRIRIDDQTAVVSADDARDVDAASGTLDCDLDERRDVVLRHLVANVCQAASSRPLAARFGIRGRARLPPERGRRPLENCERTRIAQAAGPEFQRIYFL